MNPLTLWELVFLPHFQAGLLAGLAAGVAGMAIRRWRPDWGVLWGVAALWAAFTMGIAESSTLDRVVGTYSWAYTGALLSIAAAALGISYGRHRPGLPLAVGFTIAGVWATVPDTESIGLLMGVTAALLWVWWPRNWLDLGTVGAVVVPSLLMATALLGGANRASGLMGAIGVVGVLLIYSIGRPTRPWIDVGIQVLVVLGWTRWAGLSGSAPAAFSIGVFVTVLGIAGKLVAPVLVDRWQPQPAEEDSRG